MKIITQISLFDDTQNENPGGFGTSKIDSLML